LIRSGTKGDEQHQGKLKNMRRSTRKPKTTKKKTISNTTKRKKGGEGLLEATLKERSNTEVGSRARRRALKGQDHQEKDH
jgi:hypothetical protein